MAKNGPNRVLYTEGQRIRAVDLAEEQDYLVALERRHNLTQHGPGIVTGLHAGPDWSNRQTVAAGAAVDENGTLLVLEKPSHVPATCLDAWLIRCDTPRHTRRPGTSACGSAAFDRVHEQVRVHTIAMPGEQPVPPIAGAVYLGRYGCDDPRDRRYTYLWSSIIIDPAGRAAVQVGPATERDRQAFVVSTTDASGVLASRISVDRRGTNRLNGRVDVTGYRAWARIALWDSQLMVRALRPGSAGERIHVRVQSDNDDQLRLQFFDGRRKSGDDLVLPRIASDALEKLLDDYDSELVELDLKPLPARPLVLSRLRMLHFSLTPLAAPAPPVAAALQAQPGDATLSTRGGSVELAESHAVGEANGLSFIALRESPKAPPMPGMWSVRTGTPSDPGEELRLDLGEKKDGDVSVRFSLGGRNDAGYTDALTIRGTCFVTVPELHVEGGSIQVAPIRADHTDPNFTTLLVRAWMDGLAAAIEAANDIELEIADLPALIKTGDPWDYRVLIKNNTGGVIKAGRILETWSATGMPAPLSRDITVQKDIPPGGQSVELSPVSHVSGQLTPGTLSVEIRVSGKRGDVSWRKEQTATSTVVESPAIEIEAIPDSVPRDSDWSYGYAIRNNAAVAVTLHRVVVVDDDGGSDVVLDEPLAPQQLRSFGPVQRNGIVANYPISISAELTWSDASTSTVTAGQTVRVRRDLEIAIDVLVEPEGANAWTYRLQLENVSGHDVTIVAIRHAIAGDPLVDTGIAGGAIDPLFEADIDGPAVPANATEIDLAVEIEYTREPGQTLMMRRVERRIPVS